MAIVRLPTTTSTQDVARGLPMGTVVIADHQSAGRGRLGRSWKCPPGSALLASFVLPLRSLASLRAGVAAAQACGPGTRLKWPNDVLLGGRKLAGIVVEARGEHCIVGIGVNLTWAPPGAAMLGAEVERDDLLDRLLAALQRWFAETDRDALEAWRERSDTIGRRVRVELPRETFDGVAEDIAANGSLIVSGRIVAAGDVIHLLPAERAARAPRPPAP